MEEQVISFETAKLAKEKGFNELCTQGYKSTELELGAQLGICSNTLETSFVAPTQSFLQKWLREIKRYHICVQTMFNHELYGKKDKWEINITNLDTAGFREWKDNNGVNEYENLNSYEEALELALKEVLSLIE